MSHPAIKSRETAVVALADFLAAKPAVGFKCFKFVRHNLFLKNCCFRGKIRRLERVLHGPINEPRKVNYWVRLFLCFRTLFTIFRRVESD